MIKDAKGPFDAQQRLLTLGVAQRDITRIREISASERRMREVGGVSHFFGGDRSLFSGNYQDRITTELGYPSPRIRIATETPIQKGLLRRRTEIQHGTEIKEIQPVDLAEEIAAYARELSARGVEPVNVVDFGAGAAITLSIAASLLKEEIQAGKVRLIATNVDDAPTEQNIPRIRTRFSPENAAYLIDAISNKTVTFAKADIVELYEMLKGDPVHLLFMVDMLSQIDEIATPVLQVVEEMLDPQHGTVVLSFDKTRPDYPPGDALLPKIETSLANLRQKGFTSHHPLQVATGEIISEKPLEEFEIEIYQGSEAPPFELYTV